MAEPSIESAPTRYSTVTIVLHWLIAAFVLFEVGLGLRMEAAHGAAKFAAFQLHKSVGLTILVLVGLRLIWRFYRKPPPVTATAWERALANAVHISFYALLFALPISGWLMVSTSRVAVPTLLYGVIPWPHLPGFTGMAAVGRESWRAAADFVHVNLVTVIYVLFALHVAGALKHHFLDHDGGLAKMAPGTKPGSWTDPRVISIAIGVVMAAGLGLQWAPIGSRPKEAALITQVQTSAPMPAPSTPAADGPVSPQIAPDPAPIKDAEATPQGVPSWTITHASTLRFRTNWSGDPIAGGFAQFDGDIDFSADDLDRSRVEIRIKTGSVFSGDAQRDQTLQGVDWFSVETFGVATFKADRFRKTGANRYVVNGTLRLKGASLPISFPFTLAISGKNATMRGKAVIDRTAYKVGEASTSEIPAMVDIDIVVHATQK